MSEHDSIVPDTRDWAEVLDQGCTECGFTGAEDAARISDQLRAGADRWEPVLSRHGVNQRPRSDRWSDLEYAAHVRDVMIEFRTRHGLMLIEDGPTLSNFDGDAVAVADNYASQQPANVFVILQEAAYAYAADLDDIDDEQWDRTGLREDGREFTIATLARYGLHEMRHHLHDVAG